MQKNKDFKLSTKRRQNDKKKEKNTKGHIDKETIKIKNIKKYQREYIYHFWFASSRPTEDLRTQRIRETASLKKVL